MDVRIGVIHTIKEIEIELPADADRAEVHRKVEGALADADSVLWLSDRHGAEFAIPSAKIAYVNLGRSDSERRIGFGA